MAKPVKPAKKKKSGNLLVHVVILLLLATVGWRLYALQGQVRAAQAEIHGTGLEQGFCNRSQVITIRHIGVHGIPAGKPVEQPRHGRHIH